MFFSLLNLTFQSEAIYKLYQKMPKSDIFAEISFHPINEKYIETLCRLPLRFIIMIVLVRLRQF